MSHDLVEVKRTSDIVSVVQRYISLRKEGNEYIGLCPFHTEDTPSLKVNPKKQIFKCFGCGEGGDIVDFVCKIENCNVPNALERIVTGQDVGTFQKREPRAPQKEWRQLLPGEDAPQPSFNHYRHGRPSQIWEYRTPDGLPIGYACRFDTPDGKEVLPLIYATDGKITEWRWKGFQSPRPIFGQDLLHLHQDATVILVEGEKTAQSVQSQFNPEEYVVTTWPGGGNAVGLVDWYPLVGRKVIYWPDNDCQGLSAMLHIHNLIGTELESSKFIPLDATREKGWDGADQKWQPGEILEFFASRIVDSIPTNLTALPDYLREKYGKPVQAYCFNQVGSESTYIFGLFDKLEGWQFTKLLEEEPRKPQPAPEYNEPPAPPSLPEPPPFPPFGDDDFGAHFPSDPNDPFIVLGFEKIDTGKIAYCFFDKKKKVMIRKTVESLSKSAMLELAPLNWWENKFPRKRSGIDEDSAKDWIIREASARGLFSGRSIRGRGAWMDASRVVLHAGTHLIVNGEYTQLSKIKSSYMYEISDPLDISTKDPLKSTEANRIMELFTVLPWERDLNAYLLAGWCVVAPMCGALRWRPHIWITGGAGTGKSWIMKNVVRDLLGNTALAVQGETSEAGLRQTLGMDALPVVFDEAEPTDPDANKRIQQVIALMRSSSTNDSGDILKGTAGHAAKAFKIRSCFAMASISVPVDKQSDRSRVTILSLTKKHKISLAELNQKRFEIITEDFVHRLHARTITLLPVILDNASVFAAAAASVLGEQRIGDQIGAMLAGAYSLFSSKRITLEKAIEWIKNHNWDEEQDNNQRDELQLLAHMMQQPVKVEGDLGTVERTIGELVAIAHLSMDDDAVKSITADSKLRRMGFKVDGDALVISNSADQIRRMLRDTPWSKNHNKVLIRIEGSVAMDSTRFSPGIQTRAVSVPLNGNVL